MIEKILNKFGYSKVVRDLNVDPFTEEEICKMFTEIVGDFHDYGIVKKDELKMFSDLANIDGFKDYLRLTSARDIQRYFGATDKSTQDIVKGAVSRTSFFMSMLKGRVESKSTKLGDLRYEK